MACQNCKKNKNTVASEPVSPGLLSYSATVPTVTGRDGKRVSLAQPLVEQREMGRGGWRVSIPVRGHIQDFDGENPHLVFAQVKKALFANGEGVSDLDIWFNLNIQWKKRGVRKRQVITEEDLLAVASGNAPPPRESAKNASVSPQEWGPKGWGMLQMYLAQDVYDYGRFLQLAVELLSWVNPDVNPTIGCADCYRHFSLAVAELRNNPLHVQKDARGWLVRTMNAVRKRNGKPEFTYQQAAKTNYWRG